MAEVYLGEPGNIMLRRRDGFAKVLDFWSDARSGPELSTPQQRPRFHLCDGGQAILEELQTGERYVSPGELETSFARWASTRRHSRRWRKPMLHTTQVCSILASWTEQPHSGYAVAPSLKRKPGAPSAVLRLSHRRLIMNEVELEIFITDAHRDAA